MENLHPKEIYEIKLSIKKGLTRFCRGGNSRGLKPVKALDHDMMPKEKLIPGGILETQSNKPFLFFTASYKTSDFLADGINIWWLYRKKTLSHIDRIVIKTQLEKRLIRSEKLPWYDITIKPLTVN